jgi:hypothetical protein
MYLKVVIMVITRVHQDLINEANLSIASDCGGKMQ